MLVPYGYAGATHRHVPRVRRPAAARARARAGAHAASSRVCTRAEQLVFLRERLFELALERYLPLGDPTRHLDALVALFDRARDEDVSPERVPRRSPSRLAARGRRRPGAARPRRGRGREGARLRAPTRAAAASAGASTSATRSSSRCGCCASARTCCASYQERFRYDPGGRVPGHEPRAVRAGEAAGGPAQRNLTVVGDDDQSIYRFRGAKVANILGFLDAYPAGARACCCAQNYRSRQGLLDAAYRLIRTTTPTASRSQRGYDKRLVAAIPGARAPSSAARSSPSATRPSGGRASIADAVAAGRRRAATSPSWPAPTTHLDPVRARAQGAGPAVPPEHQRAACTGAPRCGSASTCCAWWPTPATAAAPSTCSAPHSSAPIPWTWPGCRADAHRRNRSLRAVAGDLDPARLGFEPVAATREAAARFAELARRLGALAAAAAHRRDALRIRAATAACSASCVVEDTPEAEERVRNISKLFTITATGRRRCSSTTAWSSSSATSICSSRPGTTRPRPRWTSRWTRSTC